MIKVFVVPKLINSHNLCQIKYVSRFIEVLIIFIFNKNLPSDIRVSDSRALTAITF